MPKFRCTRNARYSHACTGRDDLRARQGHYVEADTREEALAEMRRSFPDDRKGERDEIAFTAHSEAEVEAMEAMQGAPTDTFAITIALPRKRVADMLVSAFEGGSNYWYFIKRFVKPSAKITPIYPDLEVIRHVDYPINEGGALIITAPADGEVGKDDPHYGPHRLDLESIRRGLAVFASKEPRHFGDLLAENDDATTADVFLQCCIFGEVIFG